MGAAAGKVLCWKMAVAAGGVHPSLEGGWGQGTI